MTEATSMVVREPEQITLGLFGTSDPIEVIERAARIATALAKVVNERKLYAIVNGRKFPTVEGWTLLGAMVGVFAHTEWTKPVKDENGVTVGYHARVVVRTLGGSELGAAEAICMRGESQQWGQNAKDYALMSMAQTRATSKAMANPLRWVFKLAGYEGTSAEDMTTVTVDGEIINPSQASRQAVAEQGAGDERPAKDGASESADDPKKLGEASPAAIQPSLTPAKTPQPPAPSEAVKRGPGRPRKDGSPPQPKRQNVVPAPVKTMDAGDAGELAVQQFGGTLERLAQDEEGQKVFLDTVRQDLRQRAALLARANALYRNNSEDRVLGRETMEIVPPAKPNAVADAALSAMINRDEFYPGESLATLDEEQLKRVSDTIEAALGKRTKQLADLKVSLTEP